jgi:S1-C subfamily serine protease
MICAQCGQSKESGAVCERCGFTAEAGSAPSANAGQTSAPAGRTNFASLDAALSLTLLRRAGLVVLSLIYLLLFLQRSGAGGEPSQARTSTTDSIQAACQATVSIRSPWGEGSGFFIDNRGRIVTNRHVVAMEAETAKQMKEERDKLSMVVQFAEALAQGSSVDRPILQDEAGAKGIAESRKRMNELDAILETYWEDKRPPKITIKTNSDLDFTAIVVTTSSKHDLALLQVPWTASPTVSLAKNASLKPGEQVFAIGSPFGIRRTVSSGIVSGSVTVGGVTYLQTDTPINPGNSGGPLLCAGGEIVGVNTMILANAQGLSFSIPIETVRGEFGISQ